MTTTLVTGATGFVAGHVIEELLTHGHRVRGTVRSLRDPGRVAHLRALAERTGGSLELVEADLLDDAGWAEAVAGCEDVLHVASPFPATVPENPRELERAAVDGTLRVLRASAGAGVRRVVTTSSVAAVAGGRPPGETRVRDESDWGDPELAPPYPRSKILAERAAWQFAGEHPELELTAINPGMVLGPIQHAAAGTSVDAVRRLLSRDIPAVPRLGFCPVDVRDVARAQRLALEAPHAAGKRYVCAGDNLWFGEMARMLAEEFGPLGYRVPTRHMPYAMLWAASRFDRNLRLALTFVGRPELVSARRAHEDLGWTMRPIRETVADTGHSLIAHGLVSR